MHGLYSTYLRRPSLRFLQKGLDRRQEQTEKRKSARLSKILALRNIQNLTKIDSPQEEENDVVVNQTEKQDQTSHRKKNETVDKTVNSTQLSEAQVHHKQHVDNTKAKLKKWKEERQRQKELQMKNKKPFLISACPKPDPPIFLISKPFSFQKENKNSNRPVIASHFKKPPAKNVNPSQKSATVPKRENRSKTKETKALKAPENPASSKISKSKRPTGKVSFAPQNFQFTYKPSFSPSYCIGTREKSNSTTMKEPFCARRSERIASKVQERQSQQASSDVTFSFPVTAVQEKNVSEDCLMNSPKARISNKDLDSGDDLMLFSP